MLAVREKYLPLQRVHYSILQKPSTMKLGHMTAIISTALAMTLSAYAQGELPDSIRTPRVPITMPTDTIDHTPAATVLPSQFEASSNAAYDRRAPIDRQLPPVNSAAYTYRAYPFTSGIAPIYTWDTGSIYASGASTSLPGAMGIETGALNFRQNFGALSLHLYGGASKYGYFRGLDTRWNFGGDVTYRFNDQWSLTAFGGYSTSGGLPRPALAGFYDTPSIGAFLDYRFARKWGVRMGIRSERSMLSGQWETRPILAPYFMLGGQPIGIDVGGILYELLRSKSDMGPRNPTIGPPVQKLSDTFH